MTSPPPDGRWHLQKVTRNPWGEIPLTGGGEFLNQHAKRYYERLLGFAEATDTDARRHHYVPKTHLKRWSSDGKRVWTLNTDTVALKQLGVTTSALPRISTGSSDPTAKLTTGWS